MESEGYECSSWTKGTREWCVFSIYGSRKWADEIVANDGFTVVPPKHKPKLAVPIAVKTDDEHPKSARSPYHPDFAQIRTPSDVLIRTGDGVLFWFSLSHLAYHSPKFALLDPETLWLISKPLESTSVLNILAIESRTFALIAHTLLLDYARRQKTLYFEEPIIGDLPPAIFDDTIVETLRRSLQFAKAWGIVSFVKMITPLMDEYAEKLVDLRL